MPSRRSTWISWLAIICWSVPLMELSAWTWESPPATTSCWNCVPRFRCRGPDEGVWRGRGWAAVIGAWGSSSEMSAKDRSTPLSIPSTLVGTTYQDIKVDSAHLPPRSSVASSCSICVAIGFGRSWGWVWGVMFGVRVASVIFTIRVEVPCYQMKKCPQYHFLVLIIVYIYISFIFCTYL